MKVDRTKRVETRKKDGMFAYAIGEIDEMVPGWGIFYEDYCSEYRYETERDAMIAGKKALSERAWETTKGTAERLSK